MNTILSVKNLFKSYKEVQAVKGISFEVQEKEVFALVGPNGAGKSSTLKVLATILTPTSGEIKIAGFDLKKQAEEIRGIISYLPKRRERIKIFWVGII